MVPPEDFDFGGPAEDSPARRIMMPRISLRFFNDEVRSILARRRCSQDCRAHQEWD